MEKILKEIEKYILLVGLFLLPLPVFSFSSNPFIVTKIQILFYTVLLYLAVKCVRIITSAKFEMSISKYDVPALLILISYLLSTILRTPNKMEAILLPGVATSIICGVMLFFFINQLGGEAKNLVTKILFASSAILSLWMILAALGLLSQLPLPAYAKAKTFTPEGGYLPSAVFLGAILSSGIGIIISEKKIAEKILWSLCGFLVSISLILSVVNILPGNPSSPKFPGLGLSWAVAVDSLKVSPVLGIGPGNYVTAFSRFRPPSYNATSLWSIKYATANNFYLTLLTEVGLLGFLGIALLLYRILRHSQVDLREKKLVNWGLASITNLISLLILVVSMALFPATILITSLFFVMLSLNTQTKRVVLNLMAESHEDKSLGSKISTRFPAILLSLPIAILVIVLFSKSVNIVKAEYNFKKAIDATSKNDTKEIYDRMRTAISLNPLVDRYRSSFSRINLILANSMAQKKELSENDKNTLTQLVQVAITEAKAAVALNPLRADNWALLGDTYRSIMPLAKGADEFAIQSYRQAIILDPINPQLRIALGGTYFAKKDYDSAINIFKTVTESIKRDHPNAHYNLAFAYKEKGMLDEAINEMTIVLSLVDKNSKDFETAQKALNDLSSKKKEAAPTGDQLVPPQEDQKIVNPPVELPEGSEPPATPSVSVTPTPSQSQTSVTPTQTATPSPSPTP